MKSGMPSCCKIIFLIIALAHYTDCKSQLAFPGAEGFGSKTRGAYSGSSSPRILIVDNLDPGDFGDQNTGRGTFLWCIRQNYPRIVLFEVGGVIDYRSRRTSINIDNPFLTIAGQTAPGKGITIIGNFLDISTHDVIIQHIRSRHGDHPGGMPYNSRMGISIINSNRIIIDHCSFSWSIRTTFNSIFSSDITFSYCLIAEPLHNSFYFDELYNNRPKPHGYAALLRNAKNITLKNNIIAYSTQRNPLTRADSIVIINNMMYNSGEIRDNINIAGRMGVNYERGLVRSVYAGNVVLRTENTTTSLSELAGIISSGINTTSEIFVHDNICVKSIQNPSVSERDKFYIANSQFQFAGSSPVDLSNYNIIDASDVEDHLLDNAGALPLRRDPADQRIINRIRNRTGEYINGVNDLPARAFNWYFQEVSVAPGYMENGFNWSQSPSSFIINGVNVTLNQNCNNLQDVLNHINPQLPSSVEAYVHPGGTYVGLRTTGKGANQSLTLSGNGLDDFGIRPGTYYGEDGPGFPYYESEKRSILGIVDYPEDNPHRDDNNNGYTNLQEWIHEMETRIYLGDETLPEGEVEICQGESESRYTISGIPQATQYNWQIVPETAGALSSSNTSVNVNWNPDFSGECHLSYIAEGQDNYVAFSPSLTIYVDPLPPAPGIPEGETSVTNTVVSSEYMATGTVEASNYDWRIVPENAGEIELIGNGSTCIINWNENFTGQVQLSVRGENQCGYGEFSSPLIINVTESGLDPGIINVFTPNGDGINDYWKIPILVDFPEARIKIFNRNNRLIIEYRGSDPSWNGTVNGSPVPMGNYFYVIELAEGETPIKGYVTVLR
jgi:gliding motility-associated-like protein